MAAGASWVYRATAFDKDLADVMADAIAEPGFAMVEVWELCTAYFSPRNQFKRSDLFQLLEDNNFERGLLRHKPRPEYSAFYREAYEKGRQKIKRKPKIKAKYSHQVKKQTGIVIAGSAGQKIKSTATIFAESAMFSGLEATQKDDYPITVRTGHSLAEIIVSPQTIEYTAIESPDYFLLLSEDGLKRSRKTIENLPRHCLMLAEKSLTLPPTKARVIALPFLETAKKIDKLSIAMVGLGALLKTSELFSVEALLTAVSTFQKSTTAENNKKAVRAGVDLIE
jgi:Pyruvate/2-oxoacid:ferredoxin oxidoreductase gamma subunit